MSFNPPKRGAASAISLDVDNVDTSKFGFNPSKRGPASAIVNILRPLLSRGLRYCFSNLIISMRKLSYKKYSCN